MTLSRKLPTSRFILSVLATSENNRTLRPPGAQAPYEHPICAPYRIPLQRLEAVAIKEPFLLADTVLSDLALFEPPLTGPFLALTYKRDQPYDHIDKPMSERRSQHRKLQNCGLVLRWLDRSRSKLMPDGPKTGLVHLDREATAKVISAITLWPKTFPAH
jgi:hypothetical protein